jgi:hypothetical protein
MPNWMTFERLGYNNADGSIPGEFLVRGTAFPTIERGGGFTTVRRGLYTVEMSWKRHGTYQVLALCRARYKGFVDPCRPQ